MSLDLHLLIFRLLINFFIQWVFFVCLKIFLCSSFFCLWLHVNVSFDFYFVYMFVSPCCLYHWIRINICLTQICILFLWPRIKNQSIHFIKMARSSTLGKSQVLIWDFPDGKLQKTTFLEFYSRTLLFL